MADKVSSDDNSVCSANYFSNWFDLFKIKGEFERKIMYESSFPLFQIYFSLFQLQMLFFFFITARAECGRETKNAVQIKDMGPSWIPYYAFPEKTFNRTRGWNAQSESQPTFPLIAQSALCSSLIRITVDSVISVSLSVPF